MCNLTKTKSDLKCHFKGKVDDSVTLAGEATSGVLRFRSVQYDGKELVPAGTDADEVTFTVVAGRKTLEIFYLFSVGETGHGHLLEKCREGKTQILRDDVEGDEPLVFYSVCGGV